MEQNKRLSLQEEMDNEARKIEEEIAKNPDLKGIEVSDEMEASLLAAIHKYEKENAKVHEKNKITADGAAEELSEKLVPDFSVCTNDGNLVQLSEEDLEALRLGREILKKKNAEEKELFEVNTKYHEHLNRDKSGKEGRTGKGRIFRMPRKKKLAIALIAVFVLVLGTGMTSVGSKSYLKILWEKMHGGQAMEVTNVEDMITQDSEDGDEVTAYRSIRETMGILPVRLGYRPEHMELRNYSLDTDQRRAILFYEYGVQIVRYTIYQNDSDSSLVQKEEDILIDTFKISTQNQKIVVKEYEVKNYSQRRYVAQFTYNGCEYQLKGIMEKEEFIKIIKDLQFV
ncbi:MAG: DUF4367 domain-containing protein [Faecalicatena sp.]|uniref:DUF4367 domain-containing protein n=1 Tax=Faecalicatena sp. TaxID=2005360 RepID=UPI002586C0BF|nr:DUF4367 domain-containing protein [Faecalicatena sp.]MCI6467397.1 DUF4367 domain-containing protein [Faecalicatena sp.]MDY5621007.1 DUF4367 domain-containing protein [Lachnospiraceae bacterium]